MVGDIVVILSIWSDIARSVDQFKDFIFDHYDSPVFWGILFLLGIILTGWAYSALNDNR